MHLQENTLFDLCPLPRNVAQSCEYAKFEVTAANSLGGDTITRKCTYERRHTCMDRRMD